MINPFNIFYDTQITVYEKGQNSYTSKGEYEFIDTLMCDIQPIESETESKIYGLSATSGYKIFCDKNELIKRGRYICFGGEWFMVVKVFNHNFGMSAVMRSVGNDG